MTDGLTVQLSRAHVPVTVLGHGRRVGLWFQGCTIGCAGCVALDTWAPDPSRAIDVDVLAERCRSLGDASGVDGVTISGGEPFDQPAALAALLRGLRPWADAAGRDLLCYSGRSLAALRSGFGDVLGLLDAIIPGPFVAAQAPGKLWRGSANQELVALTELGRRRYDGYVDRPADRLRLQAVADGAMVWYIGVPRPGDLERLDAALARRGLVSAATSWQGRTDRRAGASARGKADERPDSPGQDDGGATAVAETGAGR
jgi:anaerobic ribonucleoside-triphosphate reductase activating protein